MKLLKTIFILCFFLITSNLYATTIHVPGDSLITIQTAIDSSVVGDTVLVQPGTYNESIQINKNIVVGSLFLTTGDTSYISSTIIEPAGGVVVNFASGRDSTCVLTGFTITGGFYPGYGAGIRCVSTSPTISHNIISDNTVSSAAGCWGGGIFLEANSSPKIINNQILNNTATYSSTQGWGGGIHSRDSNPFIANNIIRGNSADVNGGGIYFLNSQVQVYNNIISDNSTQSGGGIYCDGNSSGLISGNTIFADSAWYGAGVYLNTNTNIEVTRNIIYSNYATGNAAGLHNASAQATINNNTICFNHSPTIPALYLLGADTVYNNIIYGNVGSGAVFTTTTYLKNCDFWENTGGNFLLPPPAGTGVISTVNINGDSCDVFGNIFMNPLFADTSNFDFHLTQNSPCIDAGDPSSPLDPDGTITDIGRFYFNQGFPVIASSVTSLDFGMVLIGQQSDLDLTIYNIGTDLLVLDSVYNLMPQFTHSWNQPDSLILPGDSLTVLITFTPVDTNLIVDTLSIENNDHPLQLQLSGEGSVVVGIEDQSEIPKLYALYAAYPNPFNPITTIEFDLPRQSFVILKVYNILGEELSSLLEKQMNPGRHKYIWNAGNFASGIYFFRINANEFSMVRKIILVR